MEYISLHLFRDQVEKNKFKDARIKLILEDVFRIAALKTLIEDCADVYDAGFFVLKANKMMKLAMD